MLQEQKVALITGAGIRIGRYIATHLANAGLDIVLHYYHSEKQAIEAKNEIEEMGRRCWLIRANLEYPEEAEKIMERIYRYTPIDVLINNAAIFEKVTIRETTLEIWQRHININLTAPFLLTQAFYSFSSPETTGKVINILDWRALRPGMDHFPYTISKSALVTLTQVCAQAFAPRFTVNAIAFGAILPPVDEQRTDDIIEYVPMKRWAKLDEVGEVIRFLLFGPDFITGEIIHLDGGRHLV